MNDPFFMQKRCFECEGSLDEGRIMSWFIDMAICMSCSQKEKEIKRQLPNGGRDHEGCGYTPVIKEISEEE